MRFFGHLKTVCRHRHAVFRHCVRAGILYRGLTHDLSKFSPREFCSGVKYYQGTRSPNEMERETVGYSGAWMHHKGRNRHHYEYWTDYNPSTRTIEAVKMPTVFLVEMFCDRVAASKIYRGKEYTDRDPLIYFKKGKAAFYMHPETSAALEHLLTVLADEGEDAAFALARKLVSKEKADKKLKNKSAIFKR